MRIADLRSRHAYISLADSPPDPARRAGPTPPAHHPWRSSQPTIISASPRLRRATPASRTYGRYAIGLPADP